MRPSITTSINYRTKQNFVHVRNQYIAVICANILTFAHGCAIGWLSPATLVLQSNATPILTGTLTTDELSWIGSFIAIGGIVGNIIYSTISKFYGNRVGLLLLPLPNIIYCLLVIFSDQVYTLYVARLMAGITGGASFVLLPVFVAEVASDNVRGTLGFFYSIFLNFGILFAFIIGTYVPYEMVPYVMICMPIINFVTLLCLPASPTFLLSQDKQEEAAKSLKFYRNCKNDKLRFNIEFDALKNFLEKKKQDDQNSSIRWEDIMDPIAKRGLAIGTCLIILNIGSGGFTLNFYTGSFFIRSGSLYDPNLCSIISICCQIMGIYLASLIVDKFGRRLLMMLSTAGAGLSLTVTGAFVFVSEEIMDLSEITWIPVVSLSATLFFQSIGIFPLCFVIISEVVPTKLRLFASTYCMILLSTLVFVSSRFVLPLSEVIGMYSCMWIFAAVSIAGLFFTIFILPETKGINLNSK